MVAALMLSARPGFEAFLRSNLYTCNIIQDIVKQQLYRPVFPFVHIHQGVGETVPAPYGIEQQSVAITGVDKRQINFYQYPYRPAPSISADSLRLSGIPKKKLLIIIMLNTLRQ